MPKFFATCPRGLEPALEKELNQMGISKTRAGIAGVAFEGNWGTCYLANLMSRCASRILYPVLDFPAYEPDHVYFNVLKHDWTKYIEAHHTIAMDSKVRDSKIRDLRIVSLKAKDAIVDQFRDKFSIRPDVDTFNPHLGVSIRLANNTCTVALDTSGGSLHERGYRTELHDAPLKENLAAGLLKLIDWEPTVPLYDPMCGTGTICVEAALMAQNMPPHRFKRKFGFMRWKTFQQSVYDTILHEVKSNVKQIDQVIIWGSDGSHRCVQASRVHASNSNTKKLLEFSQKDLVEIEPMVKSGIILTNPPYGERLNEVDDAIKTINQLQLICESRFKGWKVFAIIPTDISSKIKCKKLFKVYNGAIPCDLVALA